MKSLRQALDVLRPHLPNALVSPTAFARIGAVVEHLPAAVTQDVYFECHLHELESRTDVVVGVYERGREHLAVRSSLALHPNYLRAFCREWSDPARALHALVDHIWLEYDVASERPGERWSQPLSVKRHPELTPRRHRKLTPEETAYVVELERGDAPSVS